MSTRESGSRRFILRDPLSLTCKDSRSGCYETTANKGGELRNWPISWPLREARRGKRMTGQSPSKTHCIDRP